MESTGGLKNKKFVDKWSPGTYVFIEKKGAGIISS